MGYKSLVYLGTAALCLSVATVGHAKGSWKVIAQQTVGKNGDTDIVQIGNREKFAQVRLCVYGRNIRLNNFSVQFGNGHRQSLDLKSVFRAGQCSRPLDLKGERRHIETVMLNYRRLPGEGSPLVAIQAK